MKASKKILPKRPAKRPIGSDDEEDFWEEEEAPTELSGSVSGASGSSDIGDLCLDLISDLSRLRVLLLESPPEGFSENAARLEEVRRLVSSLPERSTRGKRIGFSAPE